MPQKNLAQNETIEIVVPRFANGAVEISTPSTTSATAVFVLERMVKTLTDTEEWNSMAIRDESTGLDGANLTGASKSGYAEVVAAKKVRVKRTDATGGNGGVNIEWRRS